MFFSCKLSSVYIIVKNSDCTAIYFHVPDTFYYPMSAEAR